ncbi:hypothetical protein OBBRIDRAFT_772775 [Obba rivulosa]|uniref:Uncharacterized protein n=1 Tax=Obba rivulosa TaxID=1052685 RepID=A0A8E2B2P8_9APHY|nr:hypothetical protein OBBRIDRAFT_772775 [Obba rivulosa]
MLSAWSTTRTPDHEEPVLRTYLRKATLPPMALAATVQARVPPKGHKSHANHLQTQPDGFRKLKNMYFLYHEFPSIGPSEFADRYVTSETAPEEHIDIQDFATGDRLSIPCGRMVSWTVMGLPADDVCRVHDYANYYPLRSLQRVMHVAFPQTAPFRFRDVQEPAESFDRDLIRYSIWTTRSRRLHKSSTTDIEGETLVTVVVQPPWILSSADLRSFAECPSLQNDDPYKRKFRSNERLWAKVWDICLTHKSRFFVVTNYTGWVFGAFSQGWTTGFVTGEQRAGQTGPTVLEALVYWLASAHGIEGAWRIPEIPERADYIGLESFAILPQPPKRPLSVLPSESSSESNDDAHSDAGSDSTIDAAEVAEMLLNESDGVYSDNTGGTLRTFPFEAIPTHERVAAWAQRMGQISVAQAAQMRPGSISLPDGSSPVFGMPEPSQCSSSVVLGRAELTSQGGWMVSGVRG